MRVLILILAMFLPAVALAQDDDRGFIQGLLEDALSGPGRSVVLEGFAGALSSNATIDAIRVSDEMGVWLEARDVSMTWQRSALLSGRIAIDEISIGTLDLPRKPIPLEAEAPTPEARGSFNLPDLPVAVLIDSLNLSRASLGEDWIGQTVAASLSGSAKLEGGAGDVSLTIARLDRGGALAVEGAFNNESRVLSFDASLQEPEGGIIAGLIGLPGEPDISVLAKGTGTASQFDASLNLNTGGVERLAGDFTLRPAEGQATDFAVNMGGNLTPLLAPDLVDTFGEALVLNGTGTLNAAGGVVLDDFSVLAEAINVTASGEIAPDGWPERLNLAVKVDADDQTRVVLPGIGGVGRLDLTGQFDAAQSNGWTISGTANSIDLAAGQLDRLELIGAGQITRDEQSANGRVDVSVGGLKLLDAALSSAVGQSLSAGFTFDWAAAQPLILRDIAARGSDYGVGGAVEFRNLDVLSAIVVAPDLTVNAQDFSRFGLLAQRPLAGSGRIALQGVISPLVGEFALNLSGDTRNLAIGIEQVDPLLAGDAFIDAAVRRDVSGLHVDELHVRSDHFEVDAEGSLGSDKGRIRADAAITELSRIPGAPNGSAQASVGGVLDGGVWDVSAALNAPDLVRTNYQGTIQVTEGGVAVDGRIEARADRLSGFADLAGRDLGGAISAGGRVALDSANGSFAFDLDGVSRDLVTGIGQLDTLFRGQTEFEAAVSRDADGTFDIRSVLLDSPAMNISVSGAYDGVKGDVRYELDLADVALIVPELPGRANIAGTAGYSSDAWRIDAGGTGPGGMSLAVDGTVAPNLDSVNLGLRGRAPLALANSVLRGQTLSGSLSYDLSLVGPLELASVTGQLTLDDGRFAVPAQQFAIEDLTARADIAGARATLQLDAAVSEGGTVSVRGPLQLEAPYGADLNAELRNVVVRSADLYSAEVDGEISFEGPVLGGAVISGQVDINRADMQIPSFPASYTPLEGLRHVNTPASVARTLEFAGLVQAPADAGAVPEYGLNVRVNAPNQLFISGRGLDAELGGSLLVQGSTTDIVPSGAFSLIRGRLALLGRRLELTEGEASLRGSFDPQIRFAATTDVEGVGINIGISGVATSPELAVTSVPELPQDEALSLFLFGHNITEISALQAVQLASAIRTLSGKGGPGVTQRIRDKLGVDDLDFGTNDADATEVRLGKYISDNVYTDVTVASDGTSQINLNLEVNDNTTVRGRVGNDGETGIGLFFDKDY